MGDADSRGDVAEIKIALAEQAETLAMDLFGKPTMRNTRQIRYGSKGSIRIDLRRGTFFSFEEWRGGSMLDAIMFRLGCDFLDAVAWAGDWLGGAPAPVPKRTTTHQFDADQEEAQRRSAAESIWSQTQDPTGTAAGLYFRLRKIEGCPGRFASARAISTVAGWQWWRWPAAVFPVTNDDGEIVAVQTVALNDDGTAVPRRDGPGKLKRSRGLVGLGVVRFPGPADGPLLLAEGAETAASPWLATGHETWAALGGITRLDLAGIPLGRLIVVCRDDDPRDAPSNKRLLAKLAEWRRAGRRVVVATPWPLSRGDKSDFNNLLVTVGPEAVKLRIEVAMRRPETTTAPSVSDARILLGAAIEQALARLLPA